MLLLLPQEAPHEPASPRAWKSLLRASPPRRMVAVLFFALAGLLAWWRYWPPALPTSTEISENLSAQIPPERSPTVPPRPVRPSEDREGTGGTHVQPNSKPDAPTRESAPASKAGDLLVDPFEQRYRWIPGGNYSIGSPDNEPGRQPDDLPLRDVEIDGLWLGETEVTQDFWERRMGLKNPSTYKEGQSPVETVSWFAAVKFAEILSKEAGLESCYPDLECTGAIEAAKEFSCKNTEPAPNCPGYRLPTEDEWEIAARAQSRGMEYQPYYTEPENFWTRSQSPPIPVGRRKANAWHLHDMLASVFEWTQNRDSSTPGFRMLRGGSWSSGRGDLRAASREAWNPSDARTNMGFRLALGNSPGAARAESKPKKLIEDGLQPSLEEPTTGTDRKSGAAGRDPFGLSFRWIPGALYTVGSPPTDSERFPEEAQREVAIAGFWLMETEVTEAFWAQASAKNQLPASVCADCPVVRVGWWDAV